MLLSPAVFLRLGKRVPAVPPVLLVRSLQTHAAPADFTIGNALEERFLGRAFGPAWDEELEKALPNVAVSTLVVRGTEDYLDAGDQDPAIVAPLQHGHRILVFDGGPAVAYERPEAVKVLLDDFFRYDGKFLYDHTSTAIAS